MTLSLPPRLARWTKELTGCAMAYDIDVAVLAAIVDRESLGGEALKPKGPGGKGDFHDGLWYGHGLGQIDLGSHSDFLKARLPGGGPLWAEPAFNLLYAARLLRDGIQATGCTEGGVCAYNAGVRAATEALKSLPPTATESERIRALDFRTKGHNYVSDVLSRAEHWRGLKS